MENKKSIGTTVLIVLLLIVTVASLILATYAWAKYTSNTEANATAQVAKWDVEVSTDTTKFQQTYTHVLDERIAPGTKGQLDATVAISTDTEVDVDYKIFIEEVDVVFADGSEGTATIPQNMIFKDSEGNTIDHANLKAGTVIAEGRVDAKAGKSDVTTALTWDWPYETGETDDEIIANDAKDTEDGKNPVKITITYKVDAWQVEPEGPNA